MARPPRRTSRSRKQGGGLLPQPLGLGVGIVSTSSHHYPDFESKFDEDDLTSQMIKSINNCENGVTSIGMLQNLFMRNATDLLSFLKRQQLEGNFRMTGEEDKPAIWVTTKLHLCENHCRKGKHCGGRCDSLHLCRNFLLHGGSKCWFNNNGNSCEFGHDFRSDHNLPLLRRHHLYSLRDEELHKLFKRRCARWITTMPQVCLYYNKSHGNICRNKGCKSLHLCLKFVKGICNPDQCQKNHSLDQQQVKKILDLFAIDMSWSGDDIIEDIKNIMAMREQRQEEDLESNHSGGTIDTIELNSDEELTSTENFQTPLRQAKKISPALRSLRNVSISQDHSQCCPHCANLHETLNKQQNAISALTLKVNKLSAAMETLESALSGDMPTLRM